MGPYSMQCFKANGLCGNRKVLHKSGFATVPDAACETLYRQLLMNHEDSFAFTGYRMSPQTVRAGSDRGEPFSIFWQGIPERCLYENLVESGTLV